jgi:uncharacterized protein YndB with AHSA1/START domain
MTTPEQTERDGTLTELDGRHAIRFERRLAHPPERVWTAITDRSELETWFPADIEGDLGTVGAPLRFPFREEEGPTEDGEVLESDPPRLLAYTWGGQTLRYELEPDGGGTRLVFTHALPIEESAKTAAGWQLCFDDLETALAGDGRPRSLSDEGFDEERWTKLHEGYAEEFGVDPETGRREIRELREAGKLGE